MVRLFCNIKFQQLHFSGLTKDLVDFKERFCGWKRDRTIVPIMCLIDASSRVATNHHDDLDLFTFLFSNRMLLDK